MNSRSDSMLDPAIYHSVFHTSPFAECLIAASPDFTVIDANESLLRTSARKREELVGKGLFEAFPADPTDSQDTGTVALHRSLLRAMNSGQPDEMPIQRYPIPVQLRDGTWRHEERFWSVSNTPVFDATGKLICISHRTIDVTDHARAENAEKLQAARNAFQVELAERIRPLNDPEEVTVTACELLGKFLNAERVFYGAVDETGEFIRVMQGWASSKLTSLAGKQLRLSDFDPAIVDDVCAGKVVAIEDVTTHPYCASCVDACLANGVRAFMGVPLLKKGKLISILNVHYPDIHRWSDLEIATADDMVSLTWSTLENAYPQTKLRIERDRSQAVFDTMKEGFVVLDHDWTVQYMNTEGYRLSDRVGQQAIGRNHWEMWPEYVGTDVERLYHRVMQTRSPETVEFHNTYPDGRILWLEIRVFPAMENGIALFCRDISSRKEAEERLQDAERRKDEFLAMLAHELRNPLAPIGAAAELLQRVRLSEDQLRKTSAVISRQVTHMTELIDDLLDVSRVTRGLIEMDKTPLHIQQVVTDAVEQVSPLMRANRHELTLRLTSQTAIVEGDKKRLVQVVANILNNASKYTADGGHIALRTAVDDSSVMIEIADNGIGMTSDMTKHAFDLFAQAERTSDRSSGGLGLGLALVKSLVDLHGGKVTCKSEGLGAGSTFTICLPRLPDRLHPVDRHPSESTADLETAAALRILVVDDNLDAAEMLKILLESMGHEVLVEHGPFEALERAKLCKPQVCLVDIGLPVIDGNELARRLRSQPENAGTVLIAVTGYGQESDRQSTLSAGFDHHFVKPVDTKALTSILSAAVIPD